MEPALERKSLYSVRLLITLTGMLGGCCILLMEAEECEECEECSGVCTKECAKECEKECEKV